MEDRLEWKKRYNIGVDRIDGQHQKMFRILNKLSAFSEEEEKVSWVCQEGVKFFKNYAATHFADEEAYMASISYKGLELHRRLHEDFRFRRLPALERELEEKKYEEEAIDHLRGVCTGWLIEHIQAEDQLIVRKGISRWVNLLPDRKLAAVEQEIVGILRKTLHQEPRILSECYSGETFGEELFFRCSYGAKEQEKQDLVLVFEKKLLVYMVEMMAGDSQEKSSAMLMEVVRSLVRQLEDMEEYPLLAGGYELVGENQLTGDQFRRILQRQHPRFSLLFDTGAGYFGYCALAPHHVRSESGTSKKEEHVPSGEGEATAEPWSVKPGMALEKAMAEPESAKSGTASAKAKKESEENVTDHMQQGGREKRKVLVVDDIQLDRQAMKAVLQEDYQVTIAVSGISAIRCMTLERPDLILLDYNMPVCDGPQLLEMIRSEADFADIPVIFLSSTIDKEGVKRVLPLKPEGYLLKSLKPVEIKRKIDRYFARKREN